MGRLVQLLAAILFCESAPSNKAWWQQVTDCTFCDCKVKWSVSSAEFLSYLENITVEETEDVKEIEIDRTDPWVNSRWSGPNTAKIRSP